MEELGFHLVRHLKSVVLEYHPNLSSEIYYPKRARKTQLHRSIEIHLKTAGNRQYKSAHVGREGTGNPLAENRVLIQQ